MAKYTPRIDHSKKDYESESEDIAQDKKIAKKAIGMHDKQQHEGEKTDLSKLKHGGRAKKEVGSVRKFAAGGMPAGFSPPPPPAKGGINMSGIKGAFGLTGDKLKNLQQPVRQPPIQPPVQQPPVRTPVEPKPVIQQPDRRPMPGGNYKKGGAVDNVDGKGGKSPGGKTGGLSKVPADKGAPHTAGVKKVTEKFNRGGKC